MINLYSSPLIEPQSDTVQITDIEPAIECQNIQLIVFLHSATGEELTEIAVPSAEINSTEINIMLGPGQVAPGEKIRVKINSII